MMQWTSAMERRRHPRTLVSMSMDCIRLDPDGSDVVNRLDVIDVSRSGMGALSERAFYPGQRLVLCLPPTENGEIRNINASVVRCNHRSDGYHIGLEFNLQAIGAASGTTAIALAA